MAEEDTKEEHSGAERETVTIHYIKASQFRAVHVDGVYGGVTPTGKIHMAAYSQRMAIPQQVVQYISPDGRLESEIPEKTVTRGGIVRDLEVDLVVDKDVAASMIEWLKDKIDSLEKIEESRKA